MRCAICLSVIDSAPATLIAVASIASGKASGSAFMAYQQAAHAEFAPSVRPVVYRLAAHFEFARNVLHLQSACTQQQPGCPDAEIAMTVVQRQLLQGVPLNISQFYGALHQQAQCGDACEVNKNQTRLLATLIIGYIQPRNDRS